MSIELCGKNISQYTCQMLTVMRMATIKAVLPNIFLSLEDSNSEI